MYFLTHKEAQMILDALNEQESQISVSLDLGLSTRSIVLTRDGIKVGNVTLRKNDLEKIASDSKNVYFFLKDGIFKAAIFRDNHLYRLYPTEAAPALMIDSWLMHRIKDTDPLTDAHNKARFVKKGQNALEIGTGLGYSAIACLERGASSVVTIERDENVLELAKINPYSQKLFKDPRVEIIQGDAIEKIKEVEETFDIILHDPPAFPIAGDLYSYEFYVSLHERLKPKGRLLHYVGAPGKRYRRKSFEAGIRKRLLKAGFSSIKKDELTDCLRAFF
jgi:predicted methyltransferase